MEEPVIYYGSCLCGGITYTLSGEPEQVVACYCSHCQKNAGSKYQIFAKYRSSSIDIEDPSDSMRYYTITKGTESGLPQEKHFCGNCGCTLWTVPWKHGGNIKLVRTSLIENGLAHFKPKAEIHKGQWTSDAI